MYYERRMVGNFRELWGDGAKSSSGIEALFMPGNESRRVLSPFFFLLHKPCSRDFVFSNLDDKDMLS